ncbi:MAG TPA: DNA-processing protein DprA [Bryobacteraceae bacterium]|jgi:DNA processing protein|nr:DNA-processing protein DprA [Bryobacteraceae bacterium]
MQPAPDHDEELHWLALRLVPGLGTRKAGQLIGLFRTAQAIFRASRSELEAAGLPPGIAQSIASGCTFEEAASQQEKLKEFGAQLISLIDPRYPPRLLDIFDAPPTLFVRGRVELLQTVIIGVVGTRRPTAYGTTVAARLAKDLASSAGLTVASGMARGIDTAAHRAALEAGGNTIAVFGCGVDQIYPAENRKLSLEIAEKGLTVSEFPMGTPAYPQNFPVRNRIISGMSAGVVVVEGGEYSGSSITARLATEQNREVFAVPGNITSKMSWGPNLLIKQGAKLVQEWNDVVTELSAEDRRRLANQLRKQLTIEEIKSDESVLPAAASLNPVSRSVLQALQPDAAVSLDQLVETLEGASPSEIIATLFELEMAGLVRQMPGKSFLRVWGS